MHYIFLETWNWPNTWKSLSVDDWSKYIRLAVSSDFFFNSVQKGRLMFTNHTFIKQLLRKHHASPYPIQRLSLFKKKLNKQLSTNYDAHNNRLTTLLQFCRSTHHFHIHYGQVKAHQKMQNIFSRSFGAYRKLSLFQMQMKFCAGFCGAEAKTICQWWFCFGCFPRK